jgi:hypothetical protein
VWSWRPAGGTNRGTPSALSGIVRIAVSTLEFIASLVGSLAWPLAVVVLLVVFRSTIQELLLSGLSKFKAGPFEMEWERTIAEAQAGLDYAPSASPALGRVHEQRSPGYSSELWTARPAQTVFRAHARVEEMLREKIRAAGGDVPEGLSAAGLARRARELGLIKDEMVRAVEGVQVLHNLVAHGKADEVTQKQAAEFLALVQALRYALEAPPSSED